jgi:hypothetical protein
MADALEAAAYADALTTFVATLPAPTRMVLDRALSTIYEALSHERRAGCRLCVGDLSTST